MSMFCVECGKPMEPDYRFCPSCGRSNIGMSKASIQLKPTQLRPLGNRTNQDFTLSLGVVSVFMLIVVVGVIGYMIFAGDKVSEYKVSITSKASLEDGGVLLQSCENCERISMQEDGTPLDLPLKKDYGETQSLRRHLTQQAQRYNGRGGVLNFFHEEYSNRLLHLSFDISGSVQDLDKEDDRRNASKVYSDLILERLKDILASEKHLLLPGDEVAVRFYGPTRDDNPCRETLRIKYTGPSWNAKFAYSNRTKELSILVENQISPQVQWRDGVVEINDFSLLVKEVGQFYKDALYNPNHDCHTETRLQNHLQDILDDTLQSKYDTINYVLTNDGRFVFGNSFITPTSYGVLYNLISASTPFSVDNRTLCRIPEEKFIVIGMRYDDNLVYRRVVQEFFNTIFSPCEVKFYNA